MKTRRAGMLAGAVAAVGMMGMALPAQAWSHQGHMLITRLACLRIINDPAAPAELKAFLKQNMPYDMEACKKLAEVDVVGGTPAGDYLKGFDGAATMPDRIQLMPEGKAILEPYGAPEQKMHFLDMEYVGADPNYKDDLSNTPKLETISRDPKDPHFKTAGYVMFRIDEFYKKLVIDLGKPGEEIKDAAAVHDAGYMMHYIEDCHQPHHSTADYKSFSYLAGKVAAVHEIKTKLSDGTEAITFKNDDKDVDPHGALEYKLFDDAAEPRKGLREQYWTLMMADVALIDEGKLDVMPIANDKPFDGFAQAYGMLYQGHQFLPLLGRAALAGYAGGKLNLEAFFNYKGTASGKEMTTMEMMAMQNARAVVDAEHALRKAWYEAKGQ